MAFVVVSRDAGETWTHLPFVRTIGSYYRYWGFPVWPPEHVDAVEFDGGSISICFRDEWVTFEPGGESLWTGHCSARGLWTVRRVRLMDYEGGDTSAPPQELCVQLPPGYHPPPPELLDHVAARLGSTKESRLLERLSWPLALAFGVLPVILGAGWGLLSLALVYALGLPVLSILLDRLRQRRMSNQ
jgi:hypothetical protein